MPEQSECDKLLAVKDESEAIGLFLEWLQDTKGVFLVHYPVEQPDNWFKCRNCNGDGFFCDVFNEINPRKECGVCKGSGSVKGRGRLDTMTTFPYNTENLLAEYFKIDLNKVEAEKQQILKALRAARKSDVKE